MRINAPSFLKRARFVAVAEKRMAMQVIRDRFEIFAVGPRYVAGAVISQPVEHRAFVLGSESKEILQAFRNYSGDVEVDIDDAGFLTVTDGTLEKNVELVKPHYELPKLTYEKEGWVVSIKELRSSLEAILQVDDKFDLKFEKKRLVLHAETELDEVEVPVASATSSNLERTAKYYIKDFEECLKKGLTKKVHISYSGENLVLRFGRGALYVIKGMIDG
jgi:hypothetical protein